MSDRLPEARVSIPRGRFGLDSLASSQRCQHWPAETLGSACFGFCRPILIGKVLRTHLTRFKFLSVLNDKVTTDPVVHVPKISGGRIGRSCGIALLAKKVCPRLAVQGTTLRSASFTSVATIVNLGQGSCDTPF